MSERARPKAPAWCLWILVFVLILFYLPIVTMLLNSLIVNVGDTNAFGFRWYLEVFSDSVLLEALFRSLLLGILTAFIATVLGAAAVLGIDGEARRLQSRRGLIWLRFLEFLSVTSLVLPELVFALSLLSWFFILKLQLSFWTLLIAHVTFSIAYVMMTVSARLKSLPNSLAEAAADLGATDWQILLKVKIPLLWPAIFVGAILSFLLSFDDFLISFFTTGAGSDTLPIKLYGSMKMGLSPKLSALSCLMIVISLLLLFLIWKLKGLSLFIGNEKDTN